MIKTLYLKYAVFCSVVLFSLRAGWAQESPWQAELDKGMNACGQGHYQEAERYMKTALQEAQKFGLEDTRVAQTLESMAFLYERQERYADEELALKQALSIREGLNDPQNPNLLAVIHTLARAYLRQGKYGLAEPLFRRMLSIYDTAQSARKAGKTVVVDGIAVGDGALEYATLLEQTGRKEEAKAMAERGNAILRNDPRYCGN